MEHLGKPVLLIASVFLGLLAAERTEAFRCGNKLVAEGMHEQRIVGVCGEPATRRHLGFALRAYNPRTYGRSVSGWKHSHLVGHRSLTEEVAITEFVYNFGPRKLMRRLTFEGGVLIKIETIGYGYRTR